MLFTILGKKNIFDLTSSDYIVCNLSFVNHQIKRFPILLTRRCSQQLRLQKNLRIIIYKREDGEAISRFVYYSLKSSVQIRIPER
jgi:hypothetical protein